MLMGGLAVGHTTAQGRVRACSTGRLWPQEGEVVPVPHPVALQALICRALPASHVRGTPEETVQPALRGPTRHGGTQGHGVPEG